MMTALAAGPDGVLRPGTAVDVPDGQAAELIAGGYAEDLGQPETADAGPDETGAAPGSETADAGPDETGAAPGSETGAAGPDEVRG
jgi:hypothetical protein